MTSASPPSPQASMLFYWHENQYDAEDDRNFKLNGGKLFFAMSLFSILLFFALLTLYIHKSCFLRDPTTLHAPPTQHTRYVHGGLDPAVIRSLPVVLCKREKEQEEEEEEEEERECCICLGGFEEGEKMKMLPPCRHCYHCECVDRWLKSESSCPLCRVSVRVDSSLTV